MSFGGMGSVSFGGSGSVSFGGSEFVSCGGNWSVSFGGSWSVSFRGSRSVSCGGSGSMSFGGMGSVSVGGNMSDSAGFASIKGSWSFDMCRQSFSVVWSVAVEGVTLTSRQPPSSALAVSGKHTCRCLTRDAWTFTKRAN